MSGDVQPRKRKDKRRKKEESLDEPAGPVASDEAFHVHKDIGTGGNICTKIIFFSLLAVLVGLVGLIIFEHRGTNDLDTPVSESRFAAYLVGLVDESPVKHDDHAEIEESGEQDEHDDHDEHDEHDEEGDEHDDQEDSGEPTSAETVSKQEQSEEEQEPEDSQAEDDDDDEEEEDEGDEEESQEEVTDIPGVTESIEDGDDDEDDKSQTVSGEGDDDDEEEGDQDDDDEDDQDMEESTEAASKEADEEALKKSGTPVPKVPTASPLSEKKRAEENKEVPMSKTDSEDTDAKAKSTSVTENEKKMMTVPMSATTPSPRPGKPDDGSRITGGSASVPLERSSRLETGTTSSPPLDKSVDRTKDTNRGGQTVQPQSTPSPPGDITPTQRPPHVEAGTTLPPPSGKPREEPKTVVTQKPERLTTSTEKPRTQSTVPPGSVTSDKHAEVKETPEKNKRSVEEKVSKIAPKASPVNTENKAIDATPQVETDKDKKKGNVPQNNDRLSSKVREESPVANITQTDEAMKVSKPKPQQETLIAHEGVKGSTPPSSHAGKPEEETKKPIATEVPSQQFKNVKTQESIPHGTKAPAAKTVAAEESKGQQNNGRDPSSIPKPGQVPATSKSIPTLQQKVSDDSSVKPMEEGAKSRPVPKQEVGPGEQPSAGSKVMTNTAKSQSKEKGKVSQPGRVK